MKNKGVMIFIAVISIFYAFSAWGQYSWHNRYINSVGSDWIVFDEQKNAADPIYPYTFFVPPINRLGLIQKSSIKKIDDQIYVYNLRWSDGLVGNRMPDEDFLSFADCNKKLDGNLKKGVETLRNINEIEWRKPDDNPYITSAHDKELLMEKFERKCEILNSRTP